jgi:sulfur carrier protein
MKGCGMKIIINGEEHSTKKEIVSVKELLEERKVIRPETVSVQINGSFIKRNNFSTTTVKENDEIDFIFMMSGGAC